jgi:hypothetical protein
MIKCRNLKILFRSFVSENPDTPLELAREFSEAFENFIVDNPDLSLEDTLRIFEAFVEFYQLESSKQPNYTPRQAINEFSIIGLEMLNGQDFHYIYNNFFRKNH